MLRFLMPLVLALALLFAACGGDDDSSVDDADDDATGTVTANESNSDADSTGTAAESDAASGDNATGTTTESIGDSGENSSTVPPAPGTPTDADVVAALNAVSLPVEMADGTLLGSGEAPLLVTVFEDFQCPFCLRATAFTKPGIYDYIRSGDVQLEFSPFPILGIESAQAALAAACAADQNLFWQYSHELYLTQAEAGQHSNEQLNIGRFDNDNLKQIAETVGLDRATFDTCLDSFEHESTVTEAIDRARTLGVTATPSFAVNGQLIPSQFMPANAEQWGVFIESLLEQVEGE